MKCRLFLFLILTVWSSANALSSDDEKKLREIIGLLTGEYYDEGLKQLSLYEDGLRKAVAESQEADTYMLLGRAYFYAEKDSQAKEFFRAALQIDPRHADAYFFSGLVDLYSGDFANAENSFRDAIEADSNNVTYFVELGKVLGTKNEHLAALAEFQHALALDEKSFAANFYSANIYANSGDNDQAEAHYIAALATNSSDIDCNYNLGQLYQNTEQHQLALKYFSKVVSLNSKDWRATEKIIQENQALERPADRDVAIARIYQLWRDGEVRELSERGFFIREQAQIESGRVLVLEYFELQGERPRKFVFKLQDSESGVHKFDVSLGSYDQVTRLARELGNIAADGRLYHLDGYAPSGSHFTYGFFDSIPDYEIVREMAWKVFSGELRAVSSMTPPSTVVPQ